MHHDVCNVAIAACGIGGLATEENTSVRVHGGLVDWDRLVQLPHDDGLGVVEQVLSNTGNVLDDGNLELLELLLGSNTRQKHEPGSVNSTSAENGLGLGVESVLGTVLESNVDTSDLVALDVYLADPSVGQNSQVRSLLVTTKDGVDVSNRSTASVTIVGVVRDGEETNTLSQSTL